MLRFALCSLVLLLWQASTATAQTPSWCAGVDKTQVGALLGGTAPAPKQSGPQKDDDAGGVTTMCLFPAGQKVVMTMRIEFTSAAEAQKKVSADWLKKNVEAAATYAEEKGIGDRAFWAVSSEDASFIILKGNKLYVAVLGPGKDAAAQKPGLLKLAQSLIGS